MDAHLSEVEARVLTELRDLLKHGHGTLSIHVAIPREGKRTIRIEGGKSYQFAIPEPEFQKHGDHDAQQ